MVFKSKDLMISIVPKGGQVGVDCPNCTGTTGLSTTCPKEGLADLKKMLEKARS